MEISEEMIKRASAAYAEKRHPARWDGEPWGLAGIKNHNLAIEHALRSIFENYELLERDNDD